MESARERAGEFLLDTLRLSLNPKRNILVKVRQGVHFLGAEIFPGGRRLKRRNIRRALGRLEPGNAASYRELLRKHAKKKVLKGYDWLILEELVSPS